MSHSYSQHVVFFGAAKDLARKSADTYENRSFFAGIMQENNAFKRIRSTEPSEKTGNNSKALASQGSLVVKAIFSVNR